MFAPSTCKQRLNNKGEIGAEMVDLTFHRVLIRKLPKVKIEWIEQSNYNNKIKNIGDNNNNNKIKNIGDNNNSNLLNNASKTNNRNLQQQAEHKQHQE